MKIINKASYLLSKGEHINLSPEEEKHRPLFILCTGPSLASFDVRKLANRNTMAFNRSYIAFDNWGFEPTYYCALDHVVNENNKTEIKKLIQHSKIKRFFFSKDKTSEKYFVSKRTTLVDVLSRPQGVNLDFKRKLKVANTGLFGLQLAIGLLGFRKIYLLGCDANFKDDVKGVLKDKDKYTATEDKDINHFRLDYYGKGKTYNRPQNNKFHLPAWKLFYEKYVKNNKELEIYNCSRISRLKFFVFVDYEKALQK